MTSYVEKARQAIDKCTDEQMIDILCFIEEKLQLASRCEIETKISDKYERASQMVHRAAYYLFP